MGSLQGLGIVLSRVKAILPPANEDIVTMDGWLLWNLEAQTGWNRNLKRSVSAQGSPALRESRSRTQRTHRRSPIFRTLATTAAKVVLGPYRGAMQGFAHAMHNSETQKKTTPKTETQVS